MHVFVKDIQVLNREHVLLRQHAPSLQLYNDFCKMNHISFSLNTCQSGTSCIPFISSKLNVLLLKEADSCKNYYRLQLEVW